MTKSEAIELLRDAEHAHPPTCASYSEKNGMPIISERKRCTCGAEERNQLLQDIGRWISDETVTVETFHAVRDRLRAAEAELEKKLRQSELVKLEKRDLRELAQLDELDRSELTEPTKGAGEATKPDRSEPARPQSARKPKRNLKSIAADLEAKAATT